MSYVYFLASIVPLDFLVIGSLIKIDYCCVVKRLSNNSPQRITCSYYGWDIIRGEHMKLTYND